jgi:hypothetical protein
VLGRGVVLGALLATLAFAASAQAVEFTAPQQLPKWAGGEPSLAFDPNGTGDMYVTAPQGIPSALGPVAGLPADKGVGYWGSHDGGRTFPDSLNTGAGSGGGDSDVEVATDHTVFVADLEAVAAAICTSKDRGKSFPDCDAPFAKNQQGPENDREWLTRGTKGELYLTYHDFAGGFPLIFKSTDGGQNFSPCGTIIDPSGPAASNYTPAGGTLVSKPVVGRDGTIFVEFTTPDSTASPVGAALNHLYMATSPPGGCSGSTVFTNNVIFENAGADLGKIFQAEGIDGGDNLYVTAAGKTAAGQPNTNLYLFRSADRGAHWSAPIQVNPPNLKANVLPWVAGGRGGDEMLIGWFGSEASGDPNDAKNAWRYYAATSFDGGESFDYATVTPDPIHYQDICTQGIFCGLIPGQPGNRNLADFSSVAVDPANGCAAIALPGDPENHSPGHEDDDNFGSHAYVSLQKSGPSLSPGGAPCNGKPKAGGATPLSSTNAVCGDRVEPRSSISKRHLRATRRRLLLSGRTIDRVCNTGTSKSTFRGKVAKVTIFVSKKSGKRCRFLTSKGRLSKRRSCRKPIAIPVKTRFLGHRTDKTAWSYRHRVHIPRGKYTFAARGTDAVGHRETRRRQFNTASKRVR